MKILLINNSTRLSTGGGPAYCVLALEKILQENGCEVKIFTADKDLDQPYYLMPKIDDHVIASKNIFKKASAAIQTIYNRESKDHIRNLIETFKPDIVHCHNIYNLITPSIFPVLKSKGIPIVMTLHDLKLACPNHRMFTEGAVCERCKKHKYYNAFLHRCFRNSRQVSLVGMLEAYTHYFMRSFSRYIDLFISPSRFFKEKMTEWGIPSKKIVQLNNFVSLKPYIEPRKKNQFFYFGVLSEIKGNTILLQAMTHLKNKAELVIGGTEPREEGLQKIISDKKLSNIKLLGFLEARERDQVIQESIASIIPSLFYDNQPTTVLETMACGRPVIASRIGGIPEMVSDGKEGLLVKPDHSVDLAQKMDWLLEHPTEALEMGKRGQKTIQDSFSPEKHLEKTMEVYESLLK